MLLVLHICAFFISNDSGDMSFGNIEATVPYNKSKDIYCGLSLDKFEF